jgi:hypothetical protein
MHSNDMVKFRIVQKSEKSVSVHSSFDNDRKKSDLELDANKPIHTNIEETNHRGHKPPSS